VSKYLLLEEKWAIYSYIFWENKLILCSTMTHYPNWEPNSLLLLHINDVCLKTSLYKHILFGVHLNFYMQIFNCKNFYSLHGVMINDVLDSIKCGMS
jgi:hypothetical protein